MKLWTWKLITPSPVTVGKQQGLGADVVRTAALAVGNHFSQRGRIPQAKVVTLAGDRMQAVGRVAHDGRTRRREFPGLRQAQGIAASCSDAFETTQAKTETLLQEFAKAFVV